MKKLALLLTIAFTAISVSAAEPLLLEPLNPAVYPAAAGLAAQQMTDANGVQVSSPGLQASFVPIKDSNMIPQNAAAKGEPVTKRQPRVRIQTKQRSQGNAYWNAGGKGTKSFF